MKTKDLYSVHRITVCIVYKNIRYSNVFPHFPVQSKLNAMVWYMIALFFTENKRKI